MSNPSDKSATTTMFSLFGLVELMARGLNITEAAAQAGCSPTTAEAIASSDAFKAALAKARRVN